MLRSVTLHDSIMYLGGMLEIEVLEPKNVLCLHTSFLEISVQKRGRHKKDQGEHTHRHLYPKPVILPPIRE